MTDKDDPRMKMFHAFNNVLKELNVNGASPDSIIQMMFSAVVAAAADNGIGPNKIGFALSDAIAFFINMTENNGAYSIPREATFVLINDTARAILNTYVGAGPTVQ